MIDRVVLRAPARAPSCGGNPVRRQRQDFHHKTALALVRQYDTIYHEDLQVRNMVQESPSRQEHHRCGVECVPRHPELQGCKCWENSGRGRSCVHQPDLFWLRRRWSQKGLSVRWHACPDCGTSLHRDHNAAKNIEWRGQRLRGVVGIPARRTENPWGFSPVECQKSVGRALKQPHLLGRRRELVFVGLVDALPFYVSRIPPA